MFAGFLLKWELKRKSYVKVVVVSAEVVHRIGLPERPVDHLEQCVSQSLFPLESKYKTFPLLFLFPPMVSHSCPIS